MDDVLFIIMLTASALQALWTTAMLVLYATNRHVKVAAFFVVVNVVFLLLSYYMLLYFGINEMMIALTICEFVMLIYIIPNSLKFTGDEFSKFTSDKSRTKIVIESCRDWSQTYELSEHTCNHRPYSRN